MAALLPPFVVKPLKHRAFAAAFGHKLRHAFVIQIRLDFIEKAPQPQHHMFFPMQDKQAAVRVEQQIIDKIGVLHLLAQPMGKQARGRLVPAHPVPQMIHHISRIIHAVEQFLQVALQLLLRHFAPIFRLPARLAQQPLLLLRAETQDIQHPPEKLGVGRFKLALLQARQPTRAHPAQHRHLLLAQAAAAAAGGGQADILRL